MVIEGQVAAHRCHEVTDDREHLHRRFRDWDQWACRVGATGGREYRRTCFAAAVDCMGARSVNGCVQAARACGAARARRLHTPLGCAWAYEVWAGSGRLRAAARRSGGGCRLDPMWAVCGCPGGLSAMSATAASSRHWAKRCGWMRAHDLAGGRMCMSECARWEAWMGTRHM